MMHERAEVPETIVETSRQNNNTAAGSSTEPVDGRPGAECPGRASVAEASSALASSPGPRRLRPVFVWLIVALNAVMLAVLLRDGMGVWWPPQQDALLLLKRGANYAPLTTDGQWWRIGAAMFLHFGSLHFALNMLSLISIGLAVETLCGRCGFLVIYLVSGLVANLVSVLIREDAVGVGASGAVFGVAGGLLAVIWRQRRVLDRRLIASGVSLAFWIVIACVVCHFVPIIDNTAHIAGLIAGLVCGCIESTPGGVMSPGQRWRRHGFVLTLGGTVIAGLIASHPGPPANLRAIEERLNRHLQDSNDAVKSIEAQYNARAIGMEDRNLAVEQRVVPPLSDAIELLSPTHRVPESRRALLQQWREYLTVRRNAFLLEIRALRERDRQRLEQAEELFREADRLSQQLPRGEE